MNPVPGVRKAGSRSATMGFDNRPCLVRGGAPSPVSLQFHQNRLRYARGGHLGRQEHYRAQLEHGRTAWYGSRHSRANHLYKLGHD
jgi:hypothetical protein